MRQATIVSLKSWTAVIASVIALGVPAVAGIGVFLDPVISDRTSEWVSLGPLEAIPADGVPRRMPVRVSEIDAWDRLPDEVIGSVFLIRSPDEDGLRAFQGSYHCGAQVEFDEEASQFVVPCWEGIRFDTDGRRLHSIGEWGDLLEINVRVFDRKVLVSRF